jgi:hypothetical protein
MDVAAVGSSHAAHRLPDRRGAHIGAGAAPHAAGANDSSTGHSGTLNLIHARDTVRLLIVEDEEPLPEISIDRVGLGSASARTWDR